MKLDLAVEQSASPQDILFNCEHNSRYDWISQKLVAVDFLFLQDGALLQLMVKEVIRCFVSGQFIATIFLAFALIERSIAGRLIVAGDLGVREERCFEKLLKRAQDKEWISDQEFQHIIKVCVEYRNSLVHIRMSTEVSRHESRAQNANFELYEIIEEDSRIVLDAAIRILAKTSV